MVKKCSVVLLAAGRGSRMKSDVQKQYLNLSGKPVIAYSLEALEKSFVEDVILVVGAGEESYVRQHILEPYHITKVSRIVTGGSERYHSVWAGLQATTECNVVMIHDGARPFLTQEILERGYEAAMADGGCVVGMPVKDTIKLADEDGFAADTPPRDRLWQVQTPQCFRRDVVYGAYAAFIPKEQELLSRGIRMTDDAMVVETFTDTKVRLVQGSYDNIKITTPEDLPLAESICGRMFELST